MQHETTAHYQIVHLPWLGTFSFCRSSASQRRVISGQDHSEPTLRSVQPHVRSVQVEQDAIHSVSVLQWMGPSPRSLVSWQSTGSGNE